MQTHAQDITWHVGHVVFALGCDHVLTSSTDLSDDLICNGVILTLVLELWQEGLLHVGFLDVLDIAVCFDLHDAARSRKTLSFCFPAALISYGPRKVRRRRFKGCQRAADCRGI